MNPEKVRQTFGRMGFANTEEFRLGAYVLISCRKQLIMAQNHLTAGEAQIFAFGSFTYKGNSYQGSLKNFLLDFIHAKTESGQITGNYVLIIHLKKENKTFLIIDPAFIKNVCFTEEGKVISSSFLALLESYNKPVHISTEAVREILLTGSLMGPKTLIREISRLEKKNIPAGSGVEIITFTPELTGEGTDAKSPARRQLDVLERYFVSLSALTEEFGADIGLTGGFDSRLLLAFGKKHLKNLQANSFWRENSLDFEIARELAEKTEIPFHYIKQPGIYEDPDGIIQNMEEACYFSDGHIRAQSYWMETFNTKDYASSMLNGKGVGFHGCGGEQYRNHDRYPGGRIPLETWVYYDLIYRNCGDCFVDKAAKDRFVESFSGQVRSALGHDHASIGLKEIKRYYNEIWNLSNRTLRINMLNKLSFYFAPFTEYLVSHEAYKAIPFLGRSFHFQLEMIRLADPGLAAIRSNYGFAFSDPEPLKLRALPLIFNALPRRLRYKLYVKNKKITQYQSVRNLTVKHPLFRKYSDHVKSLDLGIDIDKLTMSKVNGKLVADMGFFMEKYQTLLA